MGNACLECLELPAKRLERLLPRRCPIVKTGGAERAVLMQQAAPLEPLAPRDRRRLLKIRLQRGRPQDPHDSPRGPPPPVDRRRRAAREVAPEGGDILG